MGEISWSGLWKQETLHRWCRSVFERLEEKRAYLTCKWFIEWLIPIWEPHSNTMVWCFQLGSLDLLYNWWVMTRIHIRTRMWTNSSLASSVWLHVALGSSGNKPAACWKTLFPPASGLSVIIKAVKGHQWGATCGNKEADTGDTPPASSQEQRNIQQLLQKM